MDSKIQLGHSLLNGNFEQMSEAELKEVSRSWSIEEWERYLQTLDVGLKESQDSLNDVSRLGLASNIFEYASRSCPEEMSGLIEKLISTLTEKQKFVIQKIFFEGLSERQISRMMMISRSGVVDLKKRAIRQLKNKARKALSNFPIVEAQGFETKEPEMVRESQEKGEVSC